MRVVSHFNLYEVREVIVCIVAFLPKSIARFPRLQNTPDRQSFTRLKTDGLSSNCLPIHSPNYVNKFRESSLNQFSWICPNIHPRHTPRFAMQFIRRARYLHIPESLTFSISSRFAWDCTLEKKKWTARNNIRLFFYPSLVPKVWFLLSIELKNKTKQNKTGSCAHRRFSDSRSRQACRLQGEGKIKKIPLLVLPSVFVPTRIAIPQSNYARPSMHFREFSRTCVISSNKLFSCCRRNPR